MSTILHSAEQALGWLLGIVGPVLLLLFVPKLLTKAFASPIADLPFKQQHRLFQGYYNHLARKERYEEMEAVHDLLVEYEDGKQPTRKQLKAYKLVVKKKLRFKNDSFKMITTRYITRPDED